MQGESTCQGKRVRVAPNSQIASGNPLSPANGIVGASAVGDATDGKLVDGAHSRLDSKLVALLRDPQHHLLERFVGHPRGQEASFFGPLLPISGVVATRCNGMERVLSR